MQFQLTTSRRGRRSYIQLFNSVNLYFNSRPHEEVDFTLICNCTLFITFQLTTSRRGRLYTDLQLHLVHYISTHDLTKRSTIGCIGSVAAIPYFNSRPHEEVDAKMVNINCFLGISTHDLTKRSTVHNYSHNYIFLFQLTTSRRGRRKN